MPTWAALEVLKGAVTRTIRVSSSIRKLSRVTCTLLRLQRVPSGHHTSGETKTTIDYILLDVEAASLMDGCGTLKDHDLNTSDHLPVYRAAILPQI